MKLIMENYEIVIKENLIDELDLQIKEIYNQDTIFVITDENVYRIYANILRDKLPSFKLEFVIVHPGEESKSLFTYSKVISDLIEKGIKRNQLIMALGGGVVGDLAGFVAGTIYRGISFIQVPTSLLAMVDSSIGGKTGIDIKEGKNLVGIFNNPLRVFIDPNFLKTLPDEEYKNGLAEVLKVGLISDVSLYEYLKENDVLTINEIIKAIKVKQNIVISDPFEENIRMYLNFGHTFGHAIERHYDFAMKHGVAISYGMLIALREGIDWGITKKSLYEDVKEILIRLSLVKEPVLDKKVYIDYLKSDKKQRSDGLSFVVIKDVGNPLIIKGVNFK